MAVDDTLKNIFEELAALKAYADDSYRRGYRDGLSKAVELLSVELEGTASPSESEGTRYRAGELKARRGSVPSRILEALQESNGVTYQEIAQILERRGTPTPIQSIRSAMRRLLEGDIVQGRDHRWFLNRGFPGSADQEMQSVIASPTNKRGPGGHHAATTGA